MEGGDIMLIHCEPSFKFMHQNSEGLHKCQMIICENEPAELPKDVVRSDTKLDDGIQQLNLNLSNILEKFERGTTSNGDEDSQPSSAGVVIEKPSFDIKRTLMAFESKLGSQDSGQEKPAKKERPKVRKLTNISDFLSRRDSSEDESPPPVAAKPVPVARCGSLLMRLKKYELRIAGERVEDEDSSEEEEEEKEKKQQDNNNNDTAKKPSAKLVPEQRKVRGTGKLSSLKSQWENGDINKRRISSDEDDDDNKSNDAKKIDRQDSCTDGGSSRIGETEIVNGHRSSLTSEKDEELARIRQQMAERKLGQSKSVKNIYENAIREAQLQQQQQSSRRDSSDLSTLTNVVSTTRIQQQLLKSSTNGNGSVESQSDNSPTPSTASNKDYFQLNLSNKANILKQKFELGLINNSSHDDSDSGEGDEANRAPALTKMEQIQQEKLEELSILTEAEIQAREARNIFQQIDRRLSKGSLDRGLASGPESPRSRASVGTILKKKLANQTRASSISQQQSPVSPAQSKPEPVVKPEPAMKSEPAMKPEPQSKPDSLDKPEPLTNGITQLEFPVKTVAEAKPELSRVKSEPQKKLEPSTQKQLTDSILSSQPQNNNNKPEPKSQHQKKSGPNSQQPNKSGSIGQQQPSQKQPIRLRNNVRS